MISVKTPSVRLHRRGFLINEIVRVLSLLPGNFQFQVFPGWSVFFCRQNIFVSVNAQSQTQQNVGDDDTAAAVR